MKNNKGFTLIELMVGISLIAIIILPIFGVILGFKNKQIQISNKAEISDFRNEVVIDIEENIIKYGIRHICLSNSNKEAKLVYYEDPLDSDSIKYDDIEIDDSNNSITIGNEIKNNTYKLSIKDSKIEDFTYISKKKKDTTGYFNILENSLGNNTKTFKLIIPISYEKDDYSIVITSIFKPDNSNDYCLS